MSASRSTAHDDPVGIETVLFGVLYHPTQSAPAILDRRRRQRDPAQAILDIDHGETHFEIRKEPQEHGVLVAANPTAAVDVEQGRQRRASVARRDDIELRFIAIRNQIGDIRYQPVVLTDLHGPTRNVLRLRSARQPDQH